MHSTSMHTKMLVLVICIICILELGICMVRKNFYF
jgi:hypothetical protein